MIDSGAMAEAVEILHKALSRPVAYHRIFAQIGGGVTAGVFLSQAYYWTKSKGGNTTAETGWFYKTQAEWEAETCLTRREQETARRQLVEAGLLEEQRAGMPAKLYFRVNYHAVYQAIAAAPAIGPHEDEMQSDCPPSLYGGKRQSRMAESANQEWRKAPDMNGATSQPLSTESTTESTTENVYLPARTREIETRKPGDPPSIQSPIAQALRTLCGKTTVTLNQRDYQDLTFVLAALEQENATAAQVEEFGRKCKTHWCGRNGPPRLQTVLGEWKTVLALPEPTAGAMNHGSNNPRPAPNQNRDNQRRNGPPDRAAVREGLRRRGYSV